jgi:hydroxymethylbilane synthase
MRLLEAVTCASRGSALAMTQTRTVAASLADRGVATTILEIASTGDRNPDRSIASLGVNIYVKELEAALRDGRADYAVHSCKDLPSELPPDMRIAAISVRQDPRDAYCSEKYATFDALPPGAIVGTSSPRRRLGLAVLRPDLEYREIRGNVDTRLRKLREGQFDAIVLAMAGLVRLGIGATHTVAFDVETLVPAVAQGALAVETRAGEEGLTAKLREAINDPVAELCVTCERAALRALRAGCSAPVGIYASADGKMMRVIGFYASETGGEARRANLVREVTSLDEAQALGKEVARLIAPPG